MGEESRKGEHVCSLNELNRICSFSLRKLLAFCFSRSKLLLMLTTTFPFPFSPYLDPSCVTSVIEQSPMVS